MKKITSATIFHDAVGLRVSITYSEIDTETGRVISDNNRLDRVVTDTQQVADAEKVLTNAQAFITEE